MQAGLQTAIERAEPVQPIIILFALLPVIEGILLRVAHVYVPRFEEELVSGHDFAWKGRGHGRLF